MAPPFGCQKHQTLPVLFLNRKQIKLATQPAMIALFGFFALLEPGVEFLRRKERRAIDALHLRLLGVAFPVSARERQHLERAQPIRIRHVRPQTEIDERRTIDVIDADNLAGFLVDQFALQRLVTFGKDSQCFSL